MTNISVCVAAYNGERYIADQLRSVLASERVDEVIVSDDGSRDGTRAIVRAIGDPRIRLVDGPGAGLIRNFESLLRQARGDAIFLCDQDDLWLPDKVDVTMEALRTADLVVSDCRVVDADLNVVAPSYFAVRNAGPGLLKNLLRNTYIGCCMAFRRSVLASVLPFPADIPMHDWWIGIAAERTARTAFIPTPLMLYRRHGGNASTTGSRSPATRRRQLAWRLALVKATLARHGLRPTRIDSR
jgi:glycosyltransferase involved in cell wall biosynthesis